MLYMVSVGPCYIRKDATIETDSEWWFVHILVLECVAVKLPWPDAHRDVCADSEVIMVKITTASFNLP